VAFIFADLITFPLLLIYRKYYGTRLTLRLLLWFCAVMGVAGLAVEGLFALTGLIPADRHAHEHMGYAIQLNYTTVLNVAALAGFAYLYWLYRNRDRLGGGEGYAFDPTCGMQVRTADAPARVTVDGETSYFCCDGCRERFLQKVDRQSRD
jgi:YHS domain-containing protein